MTQSLRARPSPGAPAAFREPPRPRASAPWLLAVAAPLVLAGVLLAHRAPPVPAVGGFDAAYALDVASRLAALGPRLPGAPAHAAARALIERELAAFPDVAPVAEPTAHGTMVNLFASRPGAVPGAPIMIGAHYDSVPGAPGASDDAAGVGIVLALARLLGPRPAAGERAVVFAFWDGEEDVLAGSQADAARRRRDGTLPAAVVAYDLVGWRGGRTVLHTFRDALWAARVLPPAWLVGRALALAEAGHLDVSVGDPKLSPVYQVLTRLARLPFDADDGAYGQQGVPSFFVSDSSFTSFDPDYHLPSDTAATLSVNAVARAGRLGAALLLDTASAHGEASDGASRAWVAFGRRLVSGARVVLVDMLAALGLAFAAWRCVARRRALLLLAAYAAAVAVEPSAALLLLAPGVWVTGVLSAIPARTSPLARRLIEGTGALASLLMPGLCLVVLGVAVARFGWNPPRLAAAAPLVHLTAAAALVAYLLRPVAPLRNPPPTSPPRPPPEPG